MKMGRVDGETTPGAREGFWEIVNNLQCCECRAVMVSAAVELRIDRDKGTLSASNLYNICKSGELARISVWF